MEQVDQLIRQYCTSGDQEAFRRFYHRESPRLWRFLVARGATPDHAYDLVSESFLRFVTAVCRDPAYPRALLYRIALNAHIDRHRRESSAGERVEAEALLDLPAEEPDLVEEISVRRMVGQLHGDEQNLLLMRYWLGMTHAEIATALELPEGTVRRQAAAALERLRRLLAREERG